MYLFRVIKSFFCAFLFLLVFELGGVVILPQKRYLCFRPPPPTRARVAETATRARVKKCPTVAVKFQRDLNRGSANISEEKNISEVIDGEGQ